VAKSDDETKTTYTIVLSHITKTILDDAIRRARRQFGLADTDAAIRRIIALYNELAAKISREDLKR
jgi:hypothetical protein